MPCRHRLSASSISEAVALKEYVHCVLVVYALGCREKKAKPLRLELASCRHLEIIILTHATQAGKNYGFPSFLLIKAMKAIGGCACRGGSLYVFICIRLKIFSNKLFSGKLID